MYAIISVGIVLAIFCGFFYDTGQVKGVEQGRAQVCKEVGRTYDAGQCYSKVEKIK